jgi:hypothetical protein
MKCLPDCNICKHHIKGEKCEAFDVIPHEILSGKIKHDKPLPGQKNNLVFEQI